MKNLIIHFETIGCKLNQIETESMARSFTDLGFSVDLKPVTAASKENLPFLTIVNTCTVTAKAEQKARRLIRLLLKKHKTTPIIVTGCYAQVEKNSIEQISNDIIVVPGSVKDILAELPHHIISLKQVQEKNCAKELLINHIKSWPILLDATSQNKEKPQEKTFKPVFNQFRLSTDTFLHHSRGSIKIQDGCSNHCSYCRICIARGNPVSLGVNDVLQRVKQIEKEGQKEIVITGVNLTLYRGKITTIQNGEEKTEYWNFTKLLEYLLKNTKTVSFRISSLYPEHVTEELCNVIKDNRVRPHFHLSVQSGSNDILKAMNRNYNREAVISAVEKLRAIKPNAFFACDIIAGFPGETDKDFEDTMDLCQKCNFTWIHAFPFSPRPGTVAYTMKNQVAQRIRDERIVHLTSFAKKSKYNYAQNFENTQIKAIIEKRRTDIIRAVTENFLHVNIQGNFEELVKFAGQEVIVTITKALKPSGTEDECEAFASMDL